MLRSEPWNDKIDAKINKEKEKWQMDEENKQVTADEVYSYGESTEEPAGEPEEKA